MGDEKHIEYDNSGRMMYNENFHTNHGKPFTEEELEYLCKYYEVDDSQTISLALGRTENTIRFKISVLKKQGKYEYYKNLNKHW
ncbi:DNA-entry nuclease [Bacillus wiedmannii]|uniref:DNA-entry nuclease n=1 Tax=Bacillus wiedmannii TaxID=1890302 RepID=UPI00159B8C86|nr:DNA-entry nuclease [Bacillus wiedmannii]